MNEILCIHQMPPAWCATCKGDRLPDEQEKIEDGKVIKNILGWTQ